ncbi:kanamycin nucleotidyltransferase [Lysobacter sp. yr284]|uniref:kanamycin nucleotidyltransferase C-terminal domain-containing protein n=1 Tax=Lysobacter sp. yr284 TaxID=1761791 RepID=UPI000895E7F6|nr:kanamycin nucleotidyltransferase C-terminal domain-containing protein [Lysobacter sp. yr284]SDY99195.1 kanamycin nucleotidyltransferase [Lysobacter sp. yr284]
MDYALPQGELDTLFAGPQSVASEQRRDLVALILERLRQRFGERLLAVALYGSTARDSDGPYSDLELWAVLDDAAFGADFDESLEWVHGRGKAEVNLMSRSAVEAFARDVEETWPISHGQFVHARALWIAPDHGALFETLRSLAAHPDDAAVERAMAEIVVGELYELVGKLRNRYARKPLALLAGDFAVHLACLVGLAERHVYASAGTMFDEAADLPGPDGAVELYRLVARGELGDEAVLVAALERAWAGVEAWAREVALVDALQRRCVAGER